MISTHSSSSMSSPIGVSFTDTFASSFSSWMRSSIVRYSCARRARLALVAHAFAEEVERRGDLAALSALTAASAVSSVSPATKREAKLFREAVTPNELENARLIGEVEQTLSKH